MFKRKQAQEHKIPDLSSLTPCQAALYLHTLRENTEAAISRNAILPIVNFQNFTDCEWEKNGEIHWMDKAFPEEIEDLLFGVEDGNCEYGNDSESDDEVQ